MRLIANGIQLDLNQGTAFNFEYTSPLFKTSVEADAYSYPVELPNTVRNRRFFKYLNRPDSSAMFTEIPCILRDSTDILRGRLLVLKANSKGFSVSILKNAWDGDILEKSIRTIDYGGRRTVGDMRTHAKWTVTKNVDEADYVFYPIFNEVFYKEGSEFGNVINNWSVPNQEFIENIVRNQDGSEELYSPYFNTLVPFPYLVYILKRVAATFGKTLSGDFAKDAEIKTLTIYNTFTVDFVGENPIDGSLVNLYKNSIDIANHIPDVTIGTLLNALMRQFNLCIQITDTDLKIDFKESFLNQSVKYDMSDVAERDPSVELFKQRTQGGGYSFLSTHDSSDNVWKELAEAKIRMGEIGNPVPYRRDLVTSTTPNQTNFVIYYNAWFRAAAVGTPKFDYVRVDNVGYASNYIIGQGKEAIHAEIGTLIMQTHQTGKNDEKGIEIKIPELALMPLLPYAQQNGNSPQEEFGLETTNEFTFRLLFYRGLRRNYDNDLYPLASSDIYDTHSANQGAIAQRSLLWEGIYEKNYKQWLSTLDNAKALNLELGLDASKLSAFDMTAKYRVNQQNILPEKMSVSWTDKGVKKARMRALKF